MATSRRRLLAAGVATAALAAWPVGAANGRAARGRWLLGAAKGDGGGYLLAGLCLDDGRRFTLPLPERGHAPVVHAAGRHGVVIGRRPGRYMLLADLAEGRTVQRLDPAPGRRFYGHGVFTSDGRRLYTTENDYDGERGVVGVWEMDGRLRRVGEFPSHGIEPHQLALLPDDRTLVVANGGILTHPDMGRRKLNLDTMAPSLVYVDARSGGLVDRQSLAPGLHQLSIRHLDVSAAGLVGVACQHQGPRSDLVKLVAVSRPGAGLRLLDAPLPSLFAMRNYCASIAFDGSGKWLGVTNPRGGLVTFWDAAVGRLAESTRVRDAGGIFAAGAGGFYISTGEGSLGRIGVGDRAQTTLTLELPGIVAWDNHLTLS